MTVQIVMRTADRRGVQYLPKTIRHLHQQGIPADQIHVYPTAPEVGWINAPTRAHCTLHVPVRVYSATENMGIALASAPDCDWVLHLEDDVRPCRDFLGSVTRWIERHASEAVRFYSLFAVSIATDMRTAAAHGQTSVAYPITAFNSAVAVLMRRADAQACGTWIASQTATWRVGAGFSSWATKRGSDRLIAAWHQVAYPAQAMTLASVPCLVEHDGAVSSLRHLGNFRYVRAPLFTGEAYL